MDKTIVCVDHYGHEHEVSPERFRFRISVYGVLPEKGNILFVRERWGRKWELPGGGVRPDELLGVALAREFAEETGYVIRVGKLILHQEDFFYAEDRDEAWHSIRLVFRVYKQGGRLKRNGNGDDITDGRFLPRSKLTEPETKPGVYAIADILFRSRE